MDSTSDENPYAPPPVPDADRLPPHSPKDADGLTSPPQPHLGWALLVVLGFFLFQALAGVAIAVIGIAAMAMQFLQSPLGGQLLIVSASAATCIYAVGVVAAVYGREAVRRVALRWPSLWQTVLVALLFLPLAVVVSEINNWLIPYVPSFAMELMANLAEMPLPAIVVGMCLFPAVGEELLFRGFIGRGLVGRYGPAAGVVMTSLIFGFIHIDPLQSISACLLGGRCTTCT